MNKVRPSKITARVGYLLDTGGISNIYLHNLRGGEYKPLTEQISAHEAQRGK